MCALRDLPKETDFFNVAQWKTKMLLSEHKICKDYDLPVLAFYLYLAKVYGGHIAMAKLFDEQFYQQSIVLKYIVIFEEHTGQKIVGEWMPGDHKNFYGNPVGEALLVLGDLITNPQRVDNYKYAPKAMHDFTDVAVFAMDYIKSMQPIINEFICAVREYAKQFKDIEKHMRTPVYKGAQRSATGCLVPLIVAVSCAMLMVAVLLASI